MTATPSKPEVKSSPEKQNFTGEAITDFSKTLINQLDKALKGEPINTSKELTKGIVPGLAATTKKIVEQSQDFIPKEPLHAIIWATSGIRLSGAKLALDRYEGYPDEIEKLLPLTKEESIKASQKDMADIGSTLGQLLANHALAGRDLTQLQPELGDLGNKRSELFQAGKMDQLRLLDTILATISKPKSKKQK